MYSFTLNILSFHSWRIGANLKQKDTWSCRRGTRVGQSSEWGQTVSLIKRFNPSSNTLSVSSKFTFWKSTPPMSLNHRLPSCAAPEHHTPSQSHHPLPEHGGKGSFHPTGHLGEVEPGLCTTNGKNQTGKQIN